jgi:hypothetical protein
MGPWKNRTRIVFAGIALAIAAVLGVSHTAFANTIEAQEHGYSGFCMNDPANSQINGTAINIWACSALEKDTADAVYEGAGFYEITIGPGMCLTDPFGGGENTPVEIWECNQNVNQLWSHSTTSDGFDIWANAHTGLVINDTQDIDANGNSVIVWPGSGHAAQDWRWESISS